MSTGGCPRVVLDQDLPRPIDKVTSGPTSSFQRNHLAPATSEGQRNNEEQILPDLKNGEKTKLSI
jgi:hypothetical protein